MNVGNELKKINQRYKDLVKNFGIDSKPVQEYAQLMNKLPTVGTTSSGFKAVKQASFYTKPLKYDKVKTLDVMNRERYLDVIDQLIKMPTTSQYKMDYVKTLIWNERQEQGFETAFNDITEDEVLKMYKYFSDKVYTNDKGESVSAFQYVGETLKHLHDIIINNTEKIYSASQSITNKLRQPRGQNLLTLKEVEEVMRIVNGEQGSLQDRFEDIHPEPNRDYHSPEHRAWVDAITEWIESDGKNDVYKELLIKYGSKLLI